MKEQIKKFIAITLMLAVSTIYSLPVSYAQEATVTPTQDAVSQESSDQSDSTNTSSSSTTESSPTPTTTDERDHTREEVDRDLDADAPDNAARAYRAKLKEEEEKAAAEAAQSASTTPSPTQSQAEEGTSQDGQNGDATVKTGDAANTATIATSANKNQAGTTPSSKVGTNPTGASVINAGNGSESNNYNSATVSNGSTTEQNNSAKVNTNLKQDSVTGQNSTSDNTGGDSSLTTGDANVSGTVITDVNTNAAGMMVAEFNVVDDQRGDLILDFAANCVLGCDSGPITASNTGNGSDSVNASNADYSNDSATFQNNNAQIGNDLVLSADSGNNTASRNTDGDSNITTGDANVAANIITLANNNVAGQLVYGVVNVFGDLIGDIILTEDQIKNCCGGQMTALNSGNGSGSTNASDITVDNTTGVFQDNDVEIANNLIFDAETGDNSSSRNTGGDSSITTGSTSVDANIYNIANLNMAGGNMWLVFINQAGNWIGKLMGAPTGTTYAGSDNAEFEVDENGFITATNKNNGSDSNNDSNVTQSNTNNTTQNNTAVIENNLNLSANTGGNTASDNTGGNSSIKTGDANIIVNMVNFVNNNIVGDGKLLVTVVNVFGSWIGDFVTPGQEKQAKTDVSQNSSDNSKESVNINDENAGRGGSAQENNKNTSTSLPDALNNPVVAALAQVIVPNDSFGNSTGGSKGSQVAGANTKTLVKNANSDKEAMVQSEQLKKVVSVNLAWIVLLAPLLLAGIWGRKYALRLVRSRNKV